ncbi:MAG TPA: hypothetical protein VD948_10225 [Rhodothermales bacterium]|nr:hypothetical protein [Rhodothermales bacterium]
MARQKFTEHDKVELDPPPRRMQLTDADKVEFDDERPKQTSAAEASLRGGMQGAMPFIDEIAGGIKALAGNKDIRTLGSDYRRERDAERARTAVAEKEHEGVFRGSQVAGTVATAFVPGLGPVKNAAMLAKLGRTGANAAKAGGLGALQGLGASEADLTKGDVVGAAKDTAIGAGTAAATSAVINKAGDAARKLVGGAEARIAERPAKELLEGIPARTQDKSLAILGGKTGTAAEIAADKELNAARKNPQLFLDVVGRKADEMGEEIGTLFKNVDKADPGIARDRFLGVLGKMRDKYAADLDSPKVNAIKNEIAAIEELLGDRQVVPASVAHAVAKRYGRAGFSGNFTNPTDGKMLGREMYAAVKDELHKYVDEVAEKTGSLKDTASRLQHINKSYSRLSALEELAEKKAERAERNAPTLGKRIKDTMETGAQIAGLGTAITTGNVAALGIPVAMKAAPYVGHAADKGIVAFAKLVRAGGRPAELLQKGLALGVPRATAERMVGLFNEKD